VYGKNLENGKLPYVLSMFPNENVSEVILIKQESDRIIGNIGKHKVTFPRSVASVNGCLFSHRGFKSPAW